MLHDSNKKVSKAKARQGMSLFLWGFFTGCITLILVTVTTSMVMVENVHESTQINLSDTCAAELIKMDYVVPADGLALDQKYYNDGAIQ